LEAWLEMRKADAPTIICVSCENCVPLWDEMEQIFASAETQQRVQELQKESALALDNESRERALVGEVISTVALAGQICREFHVSEHAIDMEIDFKNDSGVPSGKGLYLHLKSGDSYERRQTDSWMAQDFPVMLVVRTPGGGVCWMEVRDLLKRARDMLMAPVKQIVFDGERFHVMAVRRWRDKALTLGQ
jgi:hypothetical protein